MMTSLCGLGFARDVDTQYSSKFDRCVQLQNSEDVDLSNKNSIEQECVEDCPWPEQTVLELFVAS